MDLIFTGISESCVHSTPPSSAPQAIQPTQKSRRSRKVGLAGLTEVQAGEIIFNLAMKHSFI